MYAHRETENGINSVVRCSRTAVPKSRLGLSLKRAESQAESSRLHHVIRLGLVAEVS